MWSVHMVCIELSDSSLLTDIPVYWASSLEYLPCTALILLLCVRMWAWEAFLNGPVSDLLHLAATAAFTGTDSWESHCPFIPTPCTLSSSLVQFREGVTGRTTRATEGKRKVRGTILGRLKIVFLCVFVCVHRVWFTWVFVDSCVSAVPTCNSLLKLCLC